MAEKIEGLDKLLSQFDGIKGIKFGNGLLGAANILQAKSMQNSPIDTSFNVNSHESELIDDTHAEMRVDDDYGYYLEFGTAKMAARPYVRPAIESENKAMVDYVKDDLESQIKGVL